MGSEQASWYLAETVLEIIVDDDPRNVVHPNFVLIRADSPEEAYEKALPLALGRSHNIGMPILTANSSPADSEVSPIST